MLSNQVKPLCLTISDDDDDDDDVNDCVVACYINKNEQKGQLVEESSSTNKEPKSETVQQNDESPLHFDNPSSTPSRSSREINDVDNEISTTPDKIEENKDNQLVVPSTESSLHSPTNSLGNKKLTNNKQLTPIKYKKASYSEPSKGKLIKSWKEKSSETSYFLHQVEFIEIDHRVEFIKVDSEEEKRRSSEKCAKLVKKIQMKQKMLNEMTKKIADFKRVD